MGRKRVSKGQIIMKKHEKLPLVADAMEAGFTDDDFVDKFKEMFPKYWDNIVKRYKEHETLNKPEKRHPMPEPRRYLLMVSRKYIDQARNKHKEQQETQTEQT